MRKEDSNRGLTGPNSETLKKDSSFGNPDFAADHASYMRKAIELAIEAGAAGESPVGCVIVAADGTIIGRGRNRREELKSAAAHAEMAAIDRACSVVGDWRLTGCSMYVTLEPCPMCAGAVIMSRIDNLYYGTTDKQTGSCGSIINLFMEPYGHKTKITGGILADECSALLSEFFSRLREGRSDIHCR